jgi:NAD(P)-dependent dehydrogenase (short-subunit alcohol dehydrogenase family)
MEGVMDLELRGRTAVITGCNVGIGREIARVLTDERARKAYLG